MKFLLAWIVLSAILLAGCTQNGGVGLIASATAGLKIPEVVQATFTAEPPKATSSPTPMVTQATLDTSPSPTPTVTQAAPEQTQTQPAASGSFEITPTATPEAPTSTPQATPTATLPAQQVQPGAEAGCIDKAAFFDDVTIPDGTSFKQSVTFKKTWQIRNEGTCTWDGYHLVYAGGDVMDGPLSNPIPVVQPGEIVNVSVDLKSPPQGGEYTGLWEFESKTGKRFGVNSHGKDFIWVKIGVSWFTPENPPENPKPPPGGTGSVQTATCAVEQNADYEAQVLALINQARADNGVPALTLRDPLSAAARSHSQDMACNDFIDHTGSDGSTWYTRIKAQNYAYAYASENIYVGDPQFGGDPQGAFIWWMNSDVHRKNILSKKVTSIGIGYAFFPGSTYKGYYTVDFARP